MCTPAVAIGLTAASGLARGIAASRSARAERAAFRQRAAQREQAARIKDIESAAEFEQGRFVASVRRAQGAQMEASQSAMAAARGIDVNNSVSLDALLASSRFAEEVDVANILTSARWSALARSSEAAQLRIGAADDVASAARINPAARALAPMLDTAVSLAGRLTPQPSPTSPRPRFRIGRR